MTYYLLDKYNNIYLNGYGYETEAEAIEAGLSQSGKWKMRCT